LAWLNVSKLPSGGDCFLSGGFERVVSRGDDGRKSIPREFNRARVDVGADEIAPVAHSRDT